MNARATSIDGDARAIHACEGGSSPTVALFRKEDWIVAEISLKLATRVIEEWHYSGGCSNTRVLTTGLYRRSKLRPSGLFGEKAFGIVHPVVGVTLWMPPIKPAAIAACPENWRGVLVCSRMVILDEIPTNAESFLLRHSMRFIDRDKWPCLLSFSDDWQGHKGTIYRAAGWKEAGKTKPEPVFVKDGRMVSRKRGPNTRTHAEMLALGCVMVGKYAKTRWIHIQEGNNGRN
jgi:hypothetical protein